MGRLAFVVVWVTAAVAQVVPGRYVVQLAGEPAATYAASHGGKRAAMASRRAQIRDEQRSVRQAAEARGAEVLSTLDTVANALIVRLPDGGASQLASIPGVARIWPVHVYRMTLDHALPLHKIPDAWAQIGGMDKAGAGIKIGILDSGIDNRHAAFQDAMLPMPAGFPKLSNDSYLPMTSNKIIVARTYEYLYGNTADPGPRDRVGHGTAVSMTAAGVPNTGPMATITGCAPKAYLGNYRITQGAGTSSWDDVIVKALDDAVQDGMDIVNISSGSPLAHRPSEDLLTTAVEAASAAGVLVVVAAGNEGPDPNTIGSPAEAPSAITVGATDSDRVFAGSVMVADHAPYLAVPGDGGNSLAPIAAPLVDVGTIDTTSMACDPLPRNSLKGAIAVILRGVCYFETKAINAQDAGALAMVVRTDQDRPDASAMALLNATLPSAMVSYDDGLDLIARVKAKSPLPGTVDFTLHSFPSRTTGLAFFSSRGPSLSDTLKPDLVATGSNLYMATQNTDYSGIMFSPDGYIVEAGTSFSSPLVAGAAAVLKSARPGLTAHEYRSLLINSAAPLATGVQADGNGPLNLMNAVRGTIAAFPTSLSLGTGAGGVDISRTVRVSNLGAATDTFTISAVASGSGPAPLVSAGAMLLAPGASGDITVHFAASGLAPGEYQGALRIQGTQTEVGATVPYWYGVSSTTPVHVTVLYSDADWPRGAVDEQGILFRITDASGIALLNVTPLVTATDGDGTVLKVYSIDTDLPGVYAVDVKMGAARGDNVFDITVGDLAPVEVTIAGT